jgi:hypothetical protein
VVFYVGLSVTGKNIKSGCEISSSQGGGNDVHSSLMMEAVRTSETSVDNYFTRQYIPEDNSEHKIRLFENKALRNNNIWI